MDFKIRNVEQRDVPFLWEMLFHSIYVPEGHNPPTRIVLRDPMISKYIDGWGRDGDIGLIAENKNGSIGAVWLRLFEDRNRGFAYIDDVTPELGIAIVEKFRGQGIGNELLKAIVKKAKAHGYQQMSLSVDPSNPARRLYERHGFIHVGWYDSSWTMKKELS